MKNQTQKGIILATMPWLIVAGCNSSGGKSPETAASQDVPPPAITPASEDQYTPEEEFASTEERNPQYVIAATTLEATEEDCGEIVVYFETDSSQLTQEGENALDEAAQCIQGNVEKADLSVTGHADPRGTEPYNESLSRQRAKSVVDYLTDQGVASSSFEIHARGEEGMKEGMPRLWPVQRRAVVEAE